MSKAKKQRANFKYRGIFGTIATITRQEGAKSLYNGLVPGLQRQMCFCAVRIGFYDHVRQLYTDKARKAGKVEIKPLSSYILNFKLALPL